MKKRAIVIDDDPACRRLIIRLLQSAGYDAIASSAESLCAGHATGGCPDSAPCADVILSDVHMPGMSGVDLFLRLEEMGCTCRRKALISGAWTIADLREAETHGWTVLSNPLPVTALASWLDRPEAEPSRRETELIRQAP